jgi:hypothetical protein
VAAHDFLDCYAALAKTNQPLGLSRRGSSQRRAGTRLCERSAAVHVPGLPAKTITLNEVAAYYPLALAGLAGLGQRLGSVSGLAACRVGLLGGTRSGFFLGAGL